MLEKIVRMMNYLGTDHCVVCGDSQYPAPWVYYQITWTSREIVIERVEKFDKESRETLAWEDLEDGIQYAFMDTLLEDCKEKAKLDIVNHYLSERLGFKL